MTDILTLRFDEKSQAHFEQMRQRYFPPERNQIPAHLTLFHMLPRIAEVADVLAAAAKIKPFAVQVTGLRSLGRGVAYTLGSTELAGLQRRLAESFAEHLSAQDRQKFQPHVVIQNKATGESARALLELLRAGFRGFEVSAEGLDLWHYLGGPWELAGTFWFGEDKAERRGRGGRAAEGAE